MELTAYFHRIYGIVPWNPLNFHGINGKNLWHFMNFHNFLLLVYLPSTAMETLKMPSEYSVDFNRGFQGFSMANLEKGIEARLSLNLSKYHIVGIHMRGLIIFRRTRVNSIVFKTYNGQCSITFKLSHLVFNNSNEIFS